MLEHVWPKARMHSALHALFTTVCLITGVGAQEREYQQLDYPGASFTSAEDLNASGQVVGQYYNSPLINNVHGFVFDGVDYQQIDVPGATSTYAFGINDNGLIAGRFNDGSSDRAFVYDRGSTIAFDVPGAISTAAWDINNQDIIVGYYLEPAPSFRRPADRAAGQPVVQELCVGPWLPVLALPVR